MRGELEGKGHQTRRVCRAGIDRRQGNNSGFALSPQPPDTRMTFGWAGTFSSGTVRRAVTRTGDGRGELGWGLIGARVRIQAFFCGSAVERGEKGSGRTGRTRAYAQERGRTAAPRTGQSPRQTARSAWQTARSARGLLDPLLDPAAREPDVHEGAVSEGRGGGLKPPCQIVYRHNHNIITS